MSIDIEGIAHDVRCDPAGLKTALPLIRQGYSPAFLARYRRDELGGVSEEALLALATEVEQQDSLDARRKRLAEKYADPERAQPVAKLIVEHALHQWELDRAARVSKTHSSLPVEGLALAAAAVCPDSGDPSTLEKLAEKVVGGGDPVKVEAACGAFAEAVVEVLCQDLRVLRPSAAWLARTARLEIGKVVDPNAVPPKKAKAKQDEGAGAAPDAASPESAKEKNTEKGTEGGSNAGGEGSAEEKNSLPEPSVAAGAQAEGEPNASQSNASEPPPTEPGSSGDSAAEQTESAKTTPPVASADASQENASGEAPSPQSSAAPPAGSNESSSPAAGEGSGPSEASSSAAVRDDAQQETPSQEAAGADGKDAKPDQPESAKSAKEEPQSRKSTGGSKSSKRLSPRQRRRKWLISVLEPLRNKTLNPTKLSAFQRLVLSRGRRSDLVHPRLVYDKEAFARHIKKQLNRLNPVVVGQIRDAFDAGAAQIVEAAEEYFWEALVENAREDLVDSLAKQLDRAVGRKPVEANVVLAVDAIGPRTASVAIVNSQRQLLHTEDLPCQMSPLLRQQLVSRLGELVHQYHVGMIAVSNGPARRPCVLAVDELLKQSPAGSLEWTLVERSGADVFAAGPAGDHQMRHVPRRFRAAAWIGRFLLSPADAIATIDPTKMRLTSYQRELETEAIREAMEARVRIGLSLRGADANSDPPALLARMPGMNRELAEQLDGRRRENLVRSRAELAEVLDWSEGQRRQAIGFLRVFGSEQTLDGTSIHPDDYPLALRLAEKLGIPTPPAEPPGYIEPDYSEPEPVADPTPDAEKLNVEQVNPGSDPATFGRGVQSEDEQASDTGQGDPPPADGGTAAADAHVGDADNAQTLSSDAADEASTDVGSSTDESSAAVTSAEETPAEETPAEEARAAEEEAGGGHTTGEEAASSEEQAGEEQAGEEQGSTAEANPAPKAIVAIKHPFPETVAIDRVIKEWQVGRNRVRQIVGWLCEPFSSAGVLSATPIPAMRRVPALAEMEKGQYVAGVVVGVTGFGAFVELGPECNGLIHVSKLSDGFVQDPHEFVQVGDVVSAWVVDIDKKRKRVALSCVSPEEQASRRHDERGRGRRGGGGQGGPPPRSSRSASRGRGGRPDGGDRRGGGGRGRDAGRGRKGGRSGEPRTIVQVSKTPEPQAEISPAMERGDEPMRSFSDLMQLYEKQNAMPEPADQAAPEDSKQKSDRPAPAASEDDASPAAQDDRSTDSPAPSAEPGAEDSKPESEVLANESVSGASAEERPEPPQN